MKIILLSRKVSISILSKKQSKDLVQPRITSGVPGLDLILDGGFLKGGVYLLLGPPGAGKTIFANQICFHQASSHKDNIVYVTLLAESHGRMMSNLRSLKYFKDEDISDSIHYMGGYHVLEKEGLKGFLRLIAGIVKEKQASILMIDGMSTIGELEQSAITFKKFAHELNSYLSASGCTAFLLSSMEGHLSKPEHTMVDGIISFHYENVGSRVSRSLEVRKFRGSGHFHGKHTYRISSNGVEVFPRLESIPRSYGPSTQVHKRVQFGMKNLDKMLNGGVYANSLTTLIGSAGTGKTSLGLQFLASGAKAGEKGLFFGFYETPDELIFKGECLSLDMKNLAKKKKIEFLWRSPLELELDEIAESLLNAVKKSGAKRVVIDGMDGFKNSVNETNRVNRFIPALIQELKALEVTTVLVEEISTFGPSDKRHIAELSAINEAVLFLHHEMIDDDINPAITILKMRNSAYNKETRKLVISEKGISVEDKLIAPEVLPTNATSVIDKGTPVNKLDKSMKKPFFKGRK